MISLCCDFDKINRAVASVNGSNYIKAVMNLYLESYETKYEFCQFYLGFNEAERVCTVILRYNSYIYIISDDNADFDELYSFLRGFNNSILYWESPANNIFYNPKTCYIMRKRGNKTDINSKVKEFSDSPLCISELLTKNMIDADKEDFFLNTAHQLRHGKLKAFAIIIDGKPISVAGVSKCYQGTKAITFVYTDEYFRGNGYSQDVLSAICLDEGCSYELLCEEHNVNFYKKCGFEQVGTCSEILL